jgi:tetratricopeptide (TPR) repeat protein
MRRALWIPLIIALAGCPPSVQPGHTKILEDVPPGQRGMPTGGMMANPHGGMANPHGGGAPFAPFAGGGGPAKPAEQGAELALPLEGNNSKAQLDRERALIADPTQAASFERAYRLTFAVDRSVRRPAEARELFLQLLQAKPGFAPAFRGVAYTWVDDGFQLEKAIAAYEQAIKADEGYGSAHYGLAFLLAQTDPEQGKKHYRRAMELGVEDERNLGTKFGWK